MSTVQVKRIVTPTRRRRSFVETAAAYSACGVDQFTEERDGRGGCVNPRLSGSRRRVADERLELRDRQNGGRDELTGLCEIAVTGNEPVRLGGERTCEKFRVGRIRWVGECARDIHEDCHSFKPGQPLMQQVRRKPELLAGEDCSRMSCCACAATSLADPSSRPVPVRSMMNDPGCEGSQTGA